MKYFISIILFFYSMSITFSQNEMTLYNPKKINIRKDRIFVMDSFRGYIIKKFTMDGKYLGDVGSDNGKLSNWINLSTEKYGRFKFKEFSTWDAIIDHNGYEIFSVSKNERQFYILKYDSNSKKIDTLYHSKNKIYGFSIDSNNNLYFVLNSSKLCKLSEDNNFTEILTEPSGLYNGISEIVIHNKIGLITSNSTDNMIRVYDDKYNLKYIFGGNKYFDVEPEDGGGGLSGFCVDDDLNIYTVDWVARRVSLFKPILVNGQITGYIFNKVLID